MLQQGKTIPLVDDAQQAIQKPVDAPIYNAAPEKGYKVSMREPKPIMQQILKKPSMITEALTGEMVYDAEGNAVGSLQWYHWLIISVILIAIAYGAYYWYKKRNQNG